MAAYYNEIDPFCCRLLRELMRCGIIADGDVDDRSIEDVLPGDLVGYTQHHFFAGVGAWSIALRLYGWPDDQPVWTGSCPCQPFSTAGKSKGFADERHLWPAFHWLICQYRPAVIFGEQVGGKNILPWIDLVSDDLEAIGYTVRSCDFPAASVDAYHIRQRLYWSAFTDASGGGACKRLAVPHSDGRGARPGHDPAVGHWQTPAPDRGTDRPRPTDGCWRAADWIECRDGKWRPVEPGIVVLVDGTPERIALLRAIGNAIVPQAAAKFIETVMEEIHE